MIRTVSAEFFLVCLVSGVFLCYAKASTECALQDFRCANGKCIRIKYLCDRYDDCKDNSDEQVCDPYHCHPLSFQCLNGKCISRRLLCDTRNNCGDNSDEQYCEPNNCHPLAFQCLNGKCINPAYFCDSSADCRDDSDQRYCDMDPSVPCPPGWTRCPSGSRCIPSSWVCNGWNDCNSTDSEETNCGAKSKQSGAEYSFAKAELKTWFLTRKTDRWGPQVHRIAVALHLADESNFGPGNSTGEEIRNELTMQLLHRLRKNRKMSSQELALYIHALLVACLDPRDFYGEDLVRELRGRVEAGGNYTDPFLVLVLCNAGDAMTDRDVGRVTAAYHSRLRPFWTESQALSSMALSCLSSRSDLSVDERTLRDMLQELKSHQLRNGTVDNLRATALVTQALFIHDSYKKDFDLDSALGVLADGLNGSRSFLNAYYTLPALNGKSLLNVTSGHCTKELVAEDEALQRELHVDEEILSEDEAFQKILDVEGETVTFQYSVWMGDKINLARTWRLKMLVNSTIYDAIEIVAKIDNRQRVEYNVVDGKPYVASLYGLEDDPEMGTYWFVYQKSLKSDDAAKIVQQSPVDIKLLPYHEIILWYKRAPWNDQNFLQEPIKSS